MNGIIMWVVVEINLIYSVTTSVVKKSILINCLILDKYGLAINSSIYAGPELSQQETTIQGNIF